MEENKPIEEAEEETESVEKEVEAEEKQEDEVEQVKNKVLGEFRKVVKEEVAKVAKTPMRKALADDTLGGDEEPKERKKAKTWFEWFRKFHGTLDEEGEEWWQ